MKLKQKKNAKLTLSDKIADALTLKPREDIEDDQVFGTKPQTLSRADFGSSDSEDEAAISDFRKRNVNLLSEVSKKYEGQIISRKELEQSGSEYSKNESDDDEEYPQNGKQKIEEDSSDSESEGRSLSKSKIQSESEIESDDDEETDNQLAQFKKRIQASDDEENDDRISQFKKQIQASDESSGGEESDDYSITQFKKQGESEGEKDDDDDDDEGEGYDISQLEEPMLENFEHVKKQNLSEDAKKGICVRNQLLVWEGLLEMRIHLQRCVSSANEMPMSETFRKLQSNNQFLEESNATKTNVANVLDKLLSLQNLLLKNFPDTKALSSKKNDKDAKQDTKEASDEEIPSDTDNEEIPSDTEPEDNVEEAKSLSKPAKSSTQIKKRKLGEYESEIANIHKAFKNFRDTSIQKWNDKTRLSTATNIKNTPTNTILQQISYILSDREKLVKRTQLKRSEYDIIGYNKEPSTVENTDQNGSELNPVTRSRKDDDEYIPEIFDDSDFYHQLLRELIECKSADISDPVQLSRQWIALQQMRSKMKRKVDTKATKGRKIKYVVHNKLVNYLGPEKSLSWTDASTNELYSSLFGKLFEHNNAGLNGNVGNLFQLK